MSDAGESQSQESQISRTAITMEVHGSESVFHRRFSQADLLAIDAILQRGPFDQVNWEVTDQQGTTSGADLPEILRNILWETVQRFSLQARHFILDSSGGPDMRAAHSYIHIYLAYEIYVSWRAAPANRQPVELAYNRLVQFLRQLPVNPGHTSRFTDIPEPQPEPQPEPEPEAKPEPQAHWWDPIRAPRSIIDWVFITVVGGALAVAAISGIAVLVSRIF